MLCGLASILSLHHVRSQYRVTYDSQDASKFLFTIPDGKKFNSTESSGGQYVLNMLESSGIVQLNTVAKNETR